jgi:hypothetical protein
MNTSDSLEQKYPEDDFATIERQEVMSEKTYNQNETVSVAYDSYTFFLFPSPIWLKEADNKKLLKELHGQFKYLGDSIGKNNLSVWFVNNKGEVDAARAWGYTRLFGLEVSGGPYIVYIRPKNSTVKEMIISHPRTGIKETKMKDSSLKSLLKEELTDKFVIDMSRLDPKCSENTLYALASQISTESIDTYTLNRDKNFCKAKNIVSISVYKVSSTLKAILDKIKVINFKGYGIELGVEFFDK